MSKSRWEANRAVWEMSKNGERMATLCPSCHSPNIFVKQEVCPPCSKCGQNLMDPPAAEKRPLA